MASLILTLINKIHYYLIVIYWFKTITILKCEYRNEWSSSRLNFQNPN